MSSTKLSGVYKITNTQNGKVYIGSSVDIKQRWNKHRRALKQQRHENQHLQHAYNAYGEDAFVFEILELIEGRDKILKAEQLYIEQYQAFNMFYGYNINPVASGGGIKIATWEELDNHKHRLTSEQLRQVVELLCTTNLSYGEIARIVGDISSATVGAVFRRDTCSELTKNYQFIEPRISEPGVCHSTLTKQEVCEIIDLLKNPLLSCASIAKQYGVLPGTIGAIFHHKHWKVLTEGIVFPPRKLRNKAVVQYTLDGEWIADYESLSAVQKNLGFNRCHIASCCNGKFSQSHGYKWKWKEQDEEMKVSGD